MAKPVEVKPDSFASEVLEQAEPVLVDFWSRTCPHCLTLNPHFEQAAETHAGRIKFVKVSIQDDAMPLFNQYHVAGVPTLILFRGGKELARQSGSRSAEQIGTWLSESL